MRAWACISSVHCMNMNGCDGSISILSPPGASNLCRLRVWSLAGVAAWVFCVALYSNPCGQRMELMR